MEGNDYAGAYWRARRESAAECARRAARFFRLLERCDPTFAQWFRGGPKAPRGTPGHPVQASEDALAELFSQSVTRTDAGHRTIEELGFRQLLWNDKRDASEIHLSCGGDARGMKNLCLLYPVRRGPVRERLLTEPVMTGILTSMATAWEPDYAMVGSSEMVEATRKQEGEVRVGWLTYLSRRLGALPPLPAPVRIEPVGDLGWLLVLSPGPLSAGNPEHVAFTASIRERLDRAGLIALPPPA